MKGTVIWTWITNSKGDVVTETEFREIVSHRNNPRFLGEQEVAWTLNQRVLSIAVDYLDL